MASATCRSELQFTVTVTNCFSDFPLVLFVIRLENGNRNLHPNCVYEARKLLPVEHWKHHFGRADPADMCSRDLVQMELSVNMQWHNGPGSVTNVDFGKGNSVPIPMEKQC